MQVYIDIYIDIYMNNSAKKKKNFFVCIECVSSVQVRSKIYKE